jgi:5-methylcytosine-specific restriction endonuclease McrA
MSGKAEIMEAALLEDGTERLIHNFEKTREFVIPSVIRLLKFIKNVYKAKVSFTKKNVLIRDEYTCAYCGSKEELTVDHVVPSSKGGKTTWENCVACCQDCNYKKGNKSVEEAKMFLKFKPYHPGLVDYLRAKVAVFGLQGITKLKMGRY